MVNKKNAMKQIFTDIELANLPLTYRFMFMKEIKNVGELRIDSIYGFSLKHDTNKYLCYINQKPKSNIIIDELF